MLRNATLRNALLPAAFLLSLFLNIPAAQAHICFQYGSGGGLSVAFGAKVPAPNTCIPVTLVEQAGAGSRYGLATASICSTDRGSGFPYLSVQYTYTACTGPGGYFESATCQIELRDGDLPTAPLGSQVSVCNGVYTGLQPNQAGPVRQFTDTTLRVWSCSDPKLQIPNAALRLCNGNRSRYSSDGEDRPALDAPLERR